MTRKKVLMLLGSVCLALILALPMVASCAGPAPSPTPSPSPSPTPTPEKFTWRIQHVYGWGDISTICAKDFVADIYDKSDGRLDMTLFAGEEIVPEMELISAVSEGILEAAIGDSTYHTSIPVGRVGELPACWNFDVPEECVEMLRQTGIADIITELYEEQNLYTVGFVPSAIGGYPTICSKYPIRTLDDFQGLIIRAYGDTAALLGHFGADTTYIPAGETYMALKLGTIDAACWDSTGIFGMSWYEVIDYYLAGGYTKPCLQLILVNMDAWNSLPEDLQDIYKDCSRSYWDAVVEAFMELEQEIVDRQEECGYEVIFLPDDDIKKMMDYAVEEIWPKFGAIDEYCLEVYHILLDYYGYE